MLSTVLSAICLLAVSSSVAAPVAEPRDTCVVLPSGRYTISSAANNWQLRPYHHSMAPPAIEAQATPPAYDFGVWEISSAPQSAYYMVNVGEGNVVSTLQFAGNPQPYTSSTAAPSAFAIQCAGGGLYVIKNPVADEVWTALPNTFVKMIGANGDISQRFEFTQA